MPISSFYGLQTSLRGLLAQQRALDTTGHNIANASTVGYSRQEATMAASPALLIPAGGVGSGASAHLGSGVDVQSYRRIRDGFLDLQYRAQATNLGDWSSRAQALDRAELALAEPGENGINSKLGKFWQSWSDLMTSPSDPAAKQAVVEAGASLGDAFATVRSQMQLVGDQARAEFADIVRPASPPSDPGGEVVQIGTQIAELNDTIRQFITAGDTPNDLLDRRDLLLDRLSKLGQVSVTDPDNDGAISVSLGGLPVVTGPNTVSWTIAPVLETWTGGGKLAGLAAIASVPGGVIDDYVSDLDDLAQSLADTVNGIYGGAFFSYGANAAASLNVAVAPSAVVAGTTGPGSNDIAKQLAQQIDGPVDRAYRAFVAKVGAQVQESMRQEANAAVLTGAVEDRRQSVAGVAMDEEMTNLVRFQRAYQASSRAMSTMDEMLDVLINRTGRVGL
jgi:flagellar hook-associated protein 1 FlgK